MSASDLFRLAISRLRTRLMVPLYRRLPLSRPLRMHIDPSSGCNFRCIFCPTGDHHLLRSVGRTPAMMEPVLFRKIIDDLASMIHRPADRLRILHLYKDGEPLLNESLEEMIHYARSRNIAREVSTTTNGSLLSEKKIRRLLDSGLDSIRISIEHVTEAGYRTITRSEHGYEEIRENVSLLYRLKSRQCHRLRVNVKITDTGLSTEEKSTFHRDFKPICDELRVDTLMGWSNGRVKDFTLGTKPATSMDGITPLVKRMVCPEPFYQLAVNADGTVSACCVDWCKGTIIGDLTKQQLYEIWSGRELRALRLTHLRGARSSIAACAECHFMQGLPARMDLDKKASRLAAKFREQLTT